MKMAATPGTAMPTRGRAHNRIRARRRWRMVCRRAPVVAAAGLLCFAIAAAAPAAAPVYTGWSEAVNLGQVVNSPVVAGSTGRDTGPWLSADELSLYFDSDRPGGSGNRDLCVSHRASAHAEWGTPVNLGPTINSPLLDAQPSLSTDGHWLFFTSSRAGGFGGQDIYRSFRANVDDDFGWQAPTNLGANVNGAAADNSAGYFENAGGVPQLFFSSDRLQAGNSDWYRAELQADGSWGLLTPVPELNSPFNEGRPWVRQDGLEIYFHRGIALGNSAVDLWHATRASVNDPWSTPINVGSPLNTAATDQDGFLSADGRTYYYDSNRPTANLGFEMYVSTRDALLTLTANDQSRLFGRANPPLTYAISGFVDGETTAVVSGTAACTTAASPSSPGGTYPITCSLGTLAAPGYSFGSFVAGTLTVTYTSPCLTGPRTGPLTVAAGQAVCIGAGGSQTGPVTVARGGSLDVEGGRIIGPVNATGGAAVRICGATITGPLTITGSTGLVLAGGDLATGQCDPNTITGPATIADNTGGVEFNGNRVIGALRITGNTGVLPPPDAGPVHAAGNTVIGPVTIQL